MQVPLIFHNKLKFTNVCFVGHLGGGVWEYLSPTKARY